MDKYQKFRRHIRFCFSASIGGIFYVIKYCVDPACWNVYELDLSGLKKIGRSAVMMCFVPASFELLGMLLIAPKLMGITLLEAAIMGAVLAAVSPAVVVPRMVKLMEEGYGVKEGIPQLILAGASVDDVYVIVLFSTFVGMMQGKGASVISFVNIPVSIILGIAIGLLIGGVKFESLKIVLKHAHTDAVTGKVTEAVSINYGNFINTALDFLIIAFSIFLFVKLINSMKRKEETKPTPPPAPSKEEQLLTEIRDLLKGKNS